MLDMETLIFRHRLQFTGLVVGPRVSVITEARPMESPLAFLVSKISKQPLWVQCFQGTGEEIIRASLARAIGEACNPAICDDPIGAMSEKFQEFAGAYDPMSFVMTTERCAKLP